MTKPTDHTDEELDAPAWETLPLTEAEKIGARHEAQVAGVASVDSLLSYIAQQGKQDGVLEAARSLSLREYLEVEAAWKHAPKPKLPRRR